MVLGFYLNLILVTTRGRGSVMIISILLRKRNRRLRGLSRLIKDFEHRESQFRTHNFSHCNVLPSFVCVCVFPNRSFH